MRAGFADEKHFELSITLKTANHRSFDLTVFNDPLAPTRFGILRLRNTQNVRGSIKKTA
jgi:hypothetical protein